MGRATLGTQLLDPPAAYNGTEPALRHNWRTHSKRGSSRSSDSGLPASKMAGVHTVVLTPSHCLTTSQGNMTEETPTPKDTAAPVTQPAESTQFSFDWEAFKPRETIKGLLSSYQKVENEGTTVAV